MEIKWYFRKNKR